jgi:TetR/AcrR family transcriptional regulator, repressor for uid operon
MSPQAARLLALAFDPSVQTADDAISERILDAALALAAASGLRHLTMDDVARRAGVGRMTVYRRMHGREDLIEALAVRECRRCLATIQDALDPEAPLIDRLASLFTATLKVIREHPLLARLARVEPEALVSELTRDGSVVFEMVRDFLVTLIEEGQRSGQLIEADPALLAELGLRLGASFVLIPDSVLALEDEEATRAEVRRLLVPLFVK